MPRGLASAEVLPPSLWPIWRRTKSPGFISARTLSQRPSLMIGAAAAAGEGAVGDVDFGGVEVVSEVVAPAEVGLIAGGGVADDEERRKSGVERRVLRGALSLRVVRLVWRAFWAKAVVARRRVSADAVEWSSAWESGLNWSLNWSMGDRVALM